jgi:hypothetical protein
MNVLLSASIPTATSKSAGVQARHHRSFQNPHPAEFSGFLFQSRGICQRDQRGVKILPECLVEVSLRIEINRRLSIIGGRIGKPLQDFGYLALPGHLRKLYAKANRYEKNNLFALSCPPPRNNAPGNDIDVRQFDVGSNNASHFSRSTS